VVAPRSLAAADPNHATLPAVSAPSLISRTVIPDTPGNLIEEVKFAGDSPLEERRFEPSVPS
jgi:hypothetical protein